MLAGQANPRSARCPNQELRPMTLSILLAERCEVLKLAIRRLTMHQVQHDLQPRLHPSRHLWPTPPHSKRPPSRRRGRRASHNRIENVARPRDIRRLPGSCPSVAMASRRRAATLHRCRRPWSFARAWRASRPATQNRRSAPPDPDRSSSRACISACLQSPQSFGRSLTRSAHIRGARSIA
jgi:hypothetical protein